MADSKNGFSERLAGAFSARLVRSLLRQTGRSLFIAHLLLLIRIIYFREIAQRTESNFLEEFSKLEEEAYIKDILSQAWRNAEILKKKFDYLKMACLFLAIAIVPWLIALAMFAAKNTQLKTLLGK